MKKKLSIILALLIISVWSIPAEFAYASKEYHETNGVFEGDIKYACEWADAHLTDLERYRTVPYEYFHESVIETTFEIIDFTRELVKDCNSDSEKIHKIHDWISLEVNYAHGRVAGYASFVAAFEKREAVCDGFAQLTTLMMNAAGIPCIYIFDDIHAWNLVYYEGKWLFMDNSSDSCKADHENGLTTYEYSLNATTCLESSVTINPEYHKIITDVIVDRVASLRKGKEFFDVVHAYDKYSCNGLYVILSNGEKITAWDSLDGLFKVEGYDKDKLGEQEVKIYSDYMNFSKTVTVMTSKNKLTYCTNSEFAIKKKYDGKTKTVKMGANNKNRKLIYTYYTDRYMTKKTTSKHGAKKNGGAPSKVGKYYVYVEVLPTSTYKGMTSSFGLRIVK